MFEALKYNLKNNRRNAMKQGTAWFIFGAIIIVFIGWGMTPRNQSLGAGGPAAIVNDAAISPVRLSEAVENLKHDPRMEQLAALGADAGRQILQQQALNQLIEMELIRQAVDRDHILTADSEVRDLITAIPAFQDQGHFRRDYYMNYLTSIRKTPAEFENEVRNEQSLRRTVKLFGEGVRPTVAELEKQKAVQGLKANLEYVTLSTDQLIAPESVKQAEVKTFLTKPENVTQVKDYYNSHKADFSEEEKVKARHILIMAKAGDAEAEKKALAKIQDIATKAKTEDFAKLATEYSEDPGSKMNGGLLDFFTRGKMVKPFEDVAFSAPVNEVSQPVKTDYGYHLIKVLEKKPAHTRSLDEATDEIAEILIARDRTQVALAALQDALKKGDQAAVNQFVADHKLKWEETGAFSIDAEAVPKIGPNDDLAKIAFSLSPEKPLADFLVRQGPKGYIARYKAVPVQKTPDKNTPETNPAMMEEMMASRSSQDALRGWVDGLRKQAKISINSTSGSRSQD